MDSLIDDEQEKKEEEQTESKAEQLGVEDKEELEELDDRLGDTFKIAAELEERIESLETELKIHKAALGNIIDAIQESDDDDIQMEDLDWDDLIN